MANLPGSSQAALVAQSELLLKIQGAIDVLDALVMRIATGEEAEVTANAERSFRFVRSFAFYILVAHTGPGPVGRG
jgi:hypothetical protein